MSKAQEQAVEPPPVVSYPRPSLALADVSEDLVSNIFKEMVESHDLDICDAMREEVELDVEANPEKYYDPAHPKKYLDYNFHLKKAIRRGLALGLDGIGPRRILDIGTGAAYFPLVCRHLGHHCEATEVYDSGFLTPVTKSFGTKVHVLRIEAGELLPRYRHRYDIITAFEISFSRRRAIAFRAPGERDEDISNLWGPTDWKFLVEDLYENQLTEDGIIWFLLNAQFPNKARYSDELLDYFISSGADVSGPNVVYYKKGNPFASA